MNPSQSPTQKKYILVVDDTVANLRLLSDMLRQQEYEVRCAKSANAALKSIAEKIPDLILLDIQMPEMDGFEVCQRVKQDPKTQNVPVIFLSAENSIESKIKGFQMGAIDYMTKPFQIEEVLVRVKTQIALQSANSEIRELNQKLQEQVIKEKQTSQELREITAQLREVTSKLQQEIVARHKAEQSSTYDAWHDSLTDLPNRRFLMDKIDSAIKKMEQSWNRFAVIKLDLDCLQVVNDVFGSDIEDQLLITFANFLRKHVCNLDTVARVGDDFVVLLEEINSLEEVVVIVERILANLQSPFDIEGNSVAISIGVGIVLSSSEYKNSSQILRDADIALRQARVQGESQYEVFKPSLYLSSLESTSIKHR